MKKRSIKRVVMGQDVQMGPITLKQPLPQGNIDQVDPFLLIHHMGPKTQQPNSPSAMDIGGHPHRGFEPVTFIFKGAVHHKDSRGNDSIIHAGGVQWMTAGMGIVHSESLPQKFTETGGDFELIQLWINLPANLKMVQPKYQGAQADDIPTWTDDEGKAKLNVISGTYGDLTGPVESLTGITAYTIEMKAGGKVHIQQGEDQNVILYQLQGLTDVNGVNSGDHRLMIFDQDGEDILLEAQTDGTLLYLAGAPINEPVTQYGPFVMNTQTEVLQAMRDYQMGKMGILL
jgi:hypothetical protein